MDCRVFRPCREVGFVVAPYFYFKIEAKAWIKHVVFFGLTGK